MHVDLLINNVCVRDDAPLVDIAIEGGRIAAMEPGIDASADEQIDAQGRAAIPGLIEAHLHLDKALLHRRLPARFGTLDEAIRVTGILKSKQEREDVLDRSRQVLDMAIRNGTTAVRAHPDVDLIQGLIGVETLLALKDEYDSLLDLQIVAFPQEGILKSKGTYELMIDALRMGADVVGGCPYNELNWDDTRRHIDIVFELAQRFGAPIDMHADFADDTSDQRFAAISYIARRTIDTGYQGRVSLGHVTSLGALDNDALAPVIEQIRLAGISIVTLPAGTETSSAPRSKFSASRSRPAERAISAWSLSASAEMRISAAATRPDSTSSRVSRSSGIPDADTASSGAFSEIG